MTDKRGLSYVEMGKKCHMDLRTAKRYAECPSRSEYTLTGPKPMKLDPYKQKIDQILEEAVYSALRILEKLRERGFDGGYSIVSIQTIQTVQLNSKHRELKCSH